MMLEERVANVISLAKSFKNAFRGIGYCIRNERNMRIHITIAAYVLAFSPFYHMNGFEYILLLIAICMVLCAEMVNTAIEATINLRTQWYDNLARVGKDVAAGAVLICSFIAVAVGCILFLKPDIIKNIIRSLIAYPLLGCLLLISLPAAALFIFRYPARARIKK